ncbi:MAG TPA: hypothetical protein PLL73_04540, partial [Syntrophorhabdaceae bacterium]|nr:hypothetical protein [Syntrophorhabdaceae bacterium]
MFDSGKVLKYLMRGNGVYGDIFIEEKTYNHIQLESSRFEKIEQGMDKGVGLRLIIPWKSFFASTNSFEEDELIHLSRVLNVSADENKELYIREASRKKAKYPFSLGIEPQEVEVKRKLEMVQRADRQARNLEKRIKQVRIIYRDTKQKITIHNSDNELIDDERDQIVFSIFVVGEDKTEMQT